MKWSNSISLQQPLQDVRLVTKAPALDWEEHLREREKAAYEKGRLEGEKATGELLQQQRNEMFQMQKGIISSLEGMLPQLAQEMESALIQLALESAQKIVGGMEIDSPTVERVVREALGQVQDTAGISIRLHPDDLALLRKHESPLLDGLPETGPLKFSASTEVSRGGCVVQTRFGLIDALRETKLEQLRKAVSL
jgi:flagellar assembly protein FliH